MLKPRRTLLFSLAALLCLALGLLPFMAQAQDGESESPFTLDALGNMTYVNELSVHGEVELVDGEFVDMADGLAVFLTGYTATGDLDGDEVDEAAVVLVADPNGSAIFFYLAVVADDGGELTNIANIQIGDRVNLVDVAIVDGQILLDMMTQGPQDPDCCPSLMVQQVYELGEDELTLVSQEELVEETESTFSPENDPTVATLEMGDPESFWLDPMMITVHSGAMSGPGVDAGLQGIGCAGVIDESPEVVLEWAENEDVDTLRIFMLSLGDPTLVVVTPDGDIACNDDLSPLVLDPYLEFKNPVAGRYAIYIGSFDGNANTPGFLTITTQDFTPATLDIAQMFPRQMAQNAVGESMSIDVLEFDTAPAAETPAAALTVDDTPFTQELVAGGELGAFDIDLGNDLCTGFIDPVPTFTFDWEGEAEKLVLFFEADADTTLLVQDPNGAFQCDDDADGAANLNPYLDLTPIVGSYTLWVGSFEPSTLVTGTLTIAGSTEYAPAALTAE